MGIFCYDAESVWHKDPPVPAVWMHQLFLEDVLKLDATVLKHHLERRMPADTDKHVSGIASQKEHVEP